MKISTDNGPIRNAVGDIRALEMIAAAGFDGVDYTFYDIRKDYDILNLPLEERKALARDIRQCAEALGLTFPQTHAALAYQYNETKDSKNYQDILRSMEYAAWIGARKIVIHTVRFPREDDSIDAIAENVKFMRGFLPLAEELDLTIGVENLFYHDLKRRCYFGRQDHPKAMNDFVDMLDSPRFEVCCDVGHCALTGVEPERFISGMNAERLTMLHIQDTDYLSDSHTIPYLGKHNWDAITTALAKIGYKGYMNLEVLHFYSHFPSHLMPAALKMAAETARSLADDVEAKMQK